MTSTIKRVVLVTGGTTGIGAATCEAMATLGYSVAANYCGNESRAAAFSERTGIPNWRWSVGDQAACLKGVAEVEAMLGPIDILVNNAGITRDSSLAKLTAENWRAVIETNLTGCFNMSQAVFTGMRNRKWGRIVNISSVNGESGQYGQANYAASKAGILGFTRSLALEGARSGVTVNAIAPGYTDTDMVRAVPPGILETIVARIPVGRLATPSEIARCIVFLAAEDAGFITGATLDVNGGQYMA